MISGDDVNRFFEAHKAVAACVYCGNKDFHLITAHEPGSHWCLVAMSPADNRDSPPSPPTNTAGIAAIVMACTNCRGLRLHAEVPIEEWVAKNPAGIA